jgi:hypothetical protein
MTISEWRTRVHPDDLAPSDELAEAEVGNAHHIRLPISPCRRWDPMDRIARAHFIRRRWLPNSVLASTSTLQNTSRLSPPIRCIVGRSGGRVPNGTPPPRSQRSANAEHILGIVQGSVFFETGSTYDAGASRPLSATFRPAILRTDSSFDLPVDSGDVGWRRRLRRNLIPKASFAHQGSDA